MGVLKAGLMFGTIVLVAMTGEATAAAAAGYGYSAYPSAAAKALCAHNLS